MDSSGGPSEGLAGLLRQLGVYDVEGVVAALAVAGLYQVADLQALDADLWSEVDGTLKDSGVSIGDRGKLKSAAKDSFRQASENAQVAEPLPPAPDITELPTDVKELRKVVAAVGLAEEGMAGSAADAIKSWAAADRTSQEVLIRGLASRAVEAAASAATVRSIAYSNSSAAALCERGELVGALCQSLRRPMPLLAWGMAALLRLSQYRPCHPCLLGQGVPQWVSLHARNSNNGGAVKLDVMASITLGLLSGSAGPEVIGQAPLRIVTPMVTMLRKRLFIADAAEVVAERLFCGMPVDFQPVVVLTALTNMMEHSGAHVAMAWQTDLPELLTGKLQGIFPNRAPARGGDPSQDEHAASLLCAKALLAREGGEAGLRAALQEASSAKGSKL
eukprot:TRINITY_DN18537_c0_g1_i1.p1 TRINITY_DN18537_c0_g1~~TRINITY_DN18537_c0_g1_i1.p1  ORF type:complete len:411 (-),score=88.93 TRINITY_DN18537_c0_g1_i1:529-1698(-)